MTVLIPFKPWVSLQTAAVLSLLAVSVAAPSQVCGGCSHLVTSQSERARHSSLIDSLILDISGGEPGRPETPSSVPPPSRPCSGAWCSSQPAAPVIPPGTTEEWVDCWAWSMAVPGSIAVVSSFLVAAEIEFRALRPTGSIFRPPRRPRFA
jgi:hypothetical protein